MYGQLWSLLQFLSKSMSIPDNFLGLPPELSDPQRAAVHILPIPFEATVSYGGGTAKGPRAIITASQQVEFYDREFGLEPVLNFGIHTLPALKLPHDPAAAFPLIEEAAAQLAPACRLPVALGGEHSITAPFVRGILQTNTEPITILQIDAHSDLRHTYEGTPYSHASVARRLLEHPQIEQILQIGIRSVCPEEVQFARENPQRVRVWYTEDTHNRNWLLELASRLQGRRVYITLDVDGLDPAIIPATGTPEPDGLTWQQTLEILRLTAKFSTIIGIDCVELAPVTGLHYADFATAKLLYKAITYALMFDNA